MARIRAFLADILENLNRADALVELNPKEKGRYVYLTCPECHQNSAYISNNGYYIYCNRQNHCGYISGIVEYIANRDSISTNDAIYKLAEISGHQIPQFNEVDNEQFRVYKQKENLLKDILSLAKNALWRFGGSIIQYLRSRSYSDSEIIEMDFGVLPVIDELKKYLLNKGHSFFLVEDIVGSFSKNHPLLIPVYNHFGTIDGFISRAIDSDISPKYLYSQGLERGTYFFNINEAKNTDTLILVEGIIDALLITNRGIKGAVACGGNSPTELQIANVLKHYKINTFILMLDNDSAGINGTLNAINLLKNHDVNIYIADNSPYKDPDELIKNVGIVELVNRLNNSQHYAKWYVNHIVNTHSISNDIEYDKALNKLLEFQNVINEPFYANYIINFICDKFSISKDILETKILSNREKYNQEKLGESYKLTLKNAQKLLKTGEIDKLSDYLTQRIIHANSIKSANLITQYPLEQAKEDIIKRPPGLDTGYEQIDKYVSIPNGAITLVAGRPSHGKTTFLLNLYLNMIEKYPDKQFYFFSYEESKTALFIKIINILAGVIVNKDLKYKNTSQLEYYIKRGANSVPDVNIAMKKYENYVNNGRLWLIDNPLDANVLSGAINNAYHRGNVGAVFIDYAQRIKYNAKFDNERVKIARISEILRETASNLDIPLIVGAQLNRENAKQKPQLDNLKEAGNLEEDANIVFGLYNWKTAIDKEKVEDDNFQGNSRKRLKNCNGGDVKINEREIDFEVHILKNRNGSINETALLTFDAPILKISNNNSKIVESPF